MKKALRFDTARLDAIRRDQNGYVEADAVVTRTGVFVYRHPDGTVTRELRHPDEVFKKDSLATLRNRPATLGHPTAGKLNARNTKHLSIGSVIGDVAHDERSVNTRLQIVDEEAIAKVMDEQDPVRELSCGYDAEIVPQQGTYNGERYDHIQKNIIYNHVALVKRGRAGHEVRVTMDAADAFQEDQEQEDDTTITLKVDGSDDGTIISRAVKDAEGVDGVYDSESKQVKRFVFQKSAGWTLEKAKSWAENHRTDSLEQETRQENRDMLKIKRDAVELKGLRLDAIELKIDGTPEGDEKAVEAALGRCDALIAHVRKQETEIAKLQGRIDAASDNGKVTASHLHEMVRERTDACSAAHFLGLVNYDKQETDNIKKLVVMKAFPDIKNDEMEQPGYIQGRYDAVIARIKQENKNLESLANVHDVAANPELFGLHKDEYVNPRDKLAKDTADMWKQPASA